MPTFQHWLTKARATDTPYGDFIHDTRRIPDHMLKPIASQEDLTNLVLRFGGYGVAYRLVPLVWRRYQTWLKSQLTK